MSSLSKGTSQEDDYERAHVREIGFLGSRRLNEVSSQTATKMMDAADRQLNTQLEYSDWVTSRSAIPACGAFG
jgi:hypothetical protein